MSCPASLSIGLVNFWLMANPGGGAVIITGSAIPINPEDGGELESLGLSLARTDRVTGLNLAVANGWTLEPVGSPPKETFNGRGTVLLPGVLSLANIGDAVTLAVRFWLEGGAIQGGAQPAKPIQLVGLAGQYAANPTVESGLSVICPDPTAGTPTLAVRQWDGAAASETPLTGASLPANPFLLIVTLERIPTVPAKVSLVAYVNAVEQPSGASPLAALIALSRFTAGDMIESDGAFSQAALWSRKLTPEEITALGDDLTCLAGAPPVGGGGPGSQDPLLTTGGETALHPGWIVPRRDPVGVLATGGEQRHTRRVHERVPRRYALGLRGARGSELDLVREALAVTRGGARSTRWRHPKDDAAGPVSTAPRWLIENADEASAFVAERSTGGQRADFALHLLEVV